MSPQSKSSMVTASTHAHTRTHINCKCFIWSINPAVQLLNVGPMDWRHRYISPGLDSVKQLSAITSLHLKTWLSFTEAASHLEKLLLYCCTSSISLQWKKIKNKKNTASTSKTLLQSVQNNTKGSQITEGLLYFKSCNTGWNEIHFLLRWSF